MYLSRITVPEVTTRNSRTLFCHKRPRYPSGFRSDILHLASRLLLADLMR